MKRKCDNCGERCNEDEMVVAPSGDWLCCACFAEAPEAYGFDLDLDGDELP